MKITSLDQYMGNISQSISSNWSENDELHLIGLLFFKQRAEVVIASTWPKRLGRRISSRVVYRTVDESAKPTILHPLRHLQSASPWMTHSYSLCTFMLMVYHDADTHAYHKWIVHSFAVNEQYAVSTTNNSITATYLWRW